MRFGRLSVLHAAPTKSGRKMWWCKCDCGNPKQTSGKSLRSGHVKSCGCLRVDTSRARFTKHGFSHTSGTYNSWVLIKQRCGNKNHPDYKDYGGRGITVCKAWVGSFTRFLTDMGECPRGMSIHRVNNNAGYCKANCVWATNHTQARAKRNNRVITSGRTTMILQDWAALLKTRASTIASRIDRLGWEHVRAVTEPVRRY